MAVKRIYLKPEAKVLNLRLCAFMVGSGTNGTNYSADNPGGGSDNLGGGTPPDPEGGESRPWGRGMWEDMQ